MIAANVSELVVEVLAELKVAVTPAGNPDAVRTACQLRLLRPVTLIVLLALLPPALMVNALGEADRLKLGAGTVKAIVVVAVSVPEVPFTVRA